MWLNLMVTDNWREFFWRILAFCSPTCQIKFGGRRDRMQSVSMDISLIVGLVVIDVVLKFARKWSEKVWRKSDYARNVAFKANLF